MSTAMEPIQVGRARRKCKFCRELGHDLRKCEKWQAKQAAANAEQAEPEPTATVLIVDGIAAPSPEPEAGPGIDPEIAAIAQLREEIDGVEIENGEYQRVLHELASRIERNKTRLVVAKAELALLRARRKR